MESLTISYVFFAGTIMTEIQIRFLLLLLIWLDYDLLHTGVKN